MIRVVFDHQIFACQAVGGISRYFCMLEQALREQELAWTQVVAPENRCDLLVQFGHVDSCTTIDVRDSLEIGRRAVLEGLSINPPDVVHETYYTGFEPCWKSGPVVTTVHDMTHEKMPSLCASSDRTAEHKRAALRRVTRDGGGVICVSENTRRDLLSLTDIPEERVHVVHHGVRSPADIKPYVADRPYALYVGYRGGYKNFSGLVRAMGLGHAARELELVCVGSYPFSPEEESLAVRYNVSVRCVECSEAELWALYAGAAFLVYPSLYEGFGMPVLEAMSVGCPVICSDSSSLPEVAGDAAMLVDTASPDALADAIDSVLFDSELRNTLKAAGLERAALFTWEACARGTADVYDSVIREYSARRG